MELELQGKVVVVTGGSKGIGFACARGFLAEGARVAIVSRHPANIDRALATLAGAIGVAADLSDAEAASHMVDRVDAALGPIDVRDSRLVRVLVRSRTRVSRRGRCARR